MPIFVGGMFKSGTSIARKYIGNNPNIFSGLETNWFYLDEYYKKQNIDSLNTTAKLWSSFFKIDYQNTLKILKNKKSSEGALEAVMNEIIKNKDLKDWCDKSPPNIKYSRRILNYWSDAKIIHVIRNPFDIFASLKEAKKWDSPKEFIKRWALIFAEVDQLSKEKNYLEIRYEFLMLDTKNTVKKIFEFCNLDWDEKYSIHAPDIDEYNLVKEITGKQSTTLKRLAEPVTKNRIGIGEKIVTNKEREEIYELVSQLGLKETFNRAINL